MTKKSGLKVEQCVEAIRKLPFSNETIYKASRVFNDRLYRKNRKPVKKGKGKGKIITAKKSKK